MFYLMCTHSATRRFMIEDTSAVAYLIDLLHDKNPQVQKVCDATLDIIAQIDDRWAERVQREKFQFHNAQWLDIIQSQQEQQQQQSDHDPIARPIHGHRGNPNGGGGGSAGGLLLDNLAASASGGYFDHDIEDFEQLVSNPLVPLEHGAKPQVNT